MKLIFTESSGKCANANNLATCYINCTAEYPIFTYMLYSGNLMHLFFVLSGALFMSSNINELAKL